MSTDEKQGDYYDKYVPLAADLGNDAAILESQVTTNADPTEKMPTQVSAPPFSVEPLPISVVVTRSDTFPAPRTVDTPMQIAIADPHRKQLRVKVIVSAGTLSHPVYLAPSSGQVYSGSQAYTLDAGEAFLLDGHTGDLWVGIPASADATVTVTTLSITK